MTLPTLPLLLAIGVAAPIGAQTGSDIWLADVVARGDTLALTNVRRVTDRPGYDNQPRFTGDGRAILYTSYRDGQADIWRYDLAAGTHTVVTATPESEYSATQVPGGSGRIAVVRVEADSTQRLWPLGANGSDRQLRAPDLRGVGYYAWMPNNYLVAFIVGDTTRLEMVDLTTGDRHVITHNIGPTFHVVPEDPSVLFVVRDGDQSQLVAWSPIDPDNPLSLGPLPGGPYFAFDPDRNVLLAPDGGGILALSTANPEPGFRPVPGLEGLNLLAITRMALSPDGSRLAFVAAEPN